MKITKLGHCCLVVEVGDLKMLTDPGVFSTAQNDVRGIDVVLITHEHADHLHVASVKAILTNNPDALVLTNASVGKLLEKEGIAYEVVEGRDTKEIKGIEIEAFDGKHEEIFEEIGQVQNTGYMIAGKLFYPGDAFTHPEKPVEILALPVAGPWCRIRDAISYALRIHPKKIFPVHDGMLQKDRIGPIHAVPTKILSEKGIEFIVLPEGEEKEL